MNGSKASGDWWKRWWSDESARSVIEEANGLLGGEDKVPDMIESIYPPPPIPSGEGFSGYSGLAGYIGESGFSGYTPAYSTSGTLYSPWAYEESKPKKRKKNEPAPLLPTTIKRKIKL